MPASSSTARLASASSLACVPFARLSTAGKPDISSDKHRIEIDGALKEFFSESVILNAGLAEMPHPSLVRAPGIEICRRLAYRPLPFGVGDDRRNGRSLRDFILHGENVGEITVVALGPDMIAGFGLDKLRGHPNAIAGFSKIAFQHVADAEFAPSHRPRGP